MSRPGGLQTSSSVEAGEVAVVRGLDVRIGDVLGSAPGRTSYRFPPPTMQAVAALRGQFGGHQVMSVEEGRALRAEAVAGPKKPETSRAKADKKEKPVQDAPSAAAQGREAAAAGPSSGSGSTGSPSGPTSGTASTRKRAAKKS